MDFGGHFLGQFDVPILRSLVTAHQQDDQFGVLDREIEAVSRAEVDPQLADLAADRLRIAEISGFDARDAGGDDARGATVFQADVPCLEAGGLERREHVYLIVYIRTVVNYKIQT